MKSIDLAQTLGALTLSLLLAGCSDSGSSGDTTDPGSGTANFSFGYGPGGGDRFDLVYRNVSVDPWEPVVMPAVAIDNFQISPPLPQGLELDPDTGTLLGAPTGVAPSRRYTITADGPGGTAEASIELGIVNPPRFALAANEGDSTFSTYFIDPSSGELEYRAYTSTELDEAGPGEIEIHPSGDFLFTLNREGNSVSSYSVDDTEGFVLSSSVTGQGTEPSFLALHPTGRFLYVTERNLEIIRLYEFDSATGTLTPSATPSFPVNATVNGIVLHPNGRFLYVTSRTESRLDAYEVDPTTGALSFRFSQPTFSTPSGISLDAAGKALYYVTDQFDLIVRWQLNPQTGELFDPRTRPTDTDPSSIQLHPSSRFVYVTNRGSNTITKYTVIDPATGRLGQPVISAVGSKPLNISFDPIGHFAYVVNQQSDNISVFRVNAQTGNLVPMETLRTRSQPSGLVMIQGEAPAQRRATHLYVTSGGSDDVTTFSTVHDERSGDPKRSPSAGG